MGETAATPAPRQQFGAFQGVYRPIVLATLGALLVLREGWLVGHTGLLGAIGVIVIAYLITGTTVLSLSSIVTNVHVRPGGAFSIVANALGLEAGGAVGIPLYFAQAMSASMYIFAFTEAWAWMFPDHPAWLLAMVGYAIVAALALTSASKAFQAQAVVLGIVVVVLLVALAGLFTNPAQPIPLTGGDSDISFFTAFAVFFPAATGIMVGVNMSGQLVDPGTDIPRGTLAAWGSTFIVYIAAAFWYATTVPLDVLRSDPTAAISYSAVSGIVWVGLLCMTLSAALSQLVSAPRLLQAMAEHHIVPDAPFLAEEAEDGEARNATMATVVLAGLALVPAYISGGLNAIAPVITSFFILTYLSINLVVAVEQRLGMISFRPRYAVDPRIPVGGAIICALGLILASPFGGLPEVLLVVAVYGWLFTRQLTTPWETVHSGVVERIAGWAAGWIARRSRSERSWKPDLLVTVGSEYESRNIWPVIIGLTRVAGSVRFVAVQVNDHLAAYLDWAVARLQSDGVMASWLGMPTGDNTEAARFALSATRGMYPAANLVVLDGSVTDETGLQATIDHCRALSAGVVVYFPELEAPLTEEGDASRVIRVWLSPPPDWKLDIHLTNVDLPVLIGFLFHRAWGAPIELMCCVETDAEVREARAFLERLIKWGRLPANTTIDVARTRFHDKVRKSPKGYIHLFGLADTVKVGDLLAIQQASAGACLFLKDSGQESALA